MALRAYGNHCFAAGKTLSGFRHTIIAAQRRLLGCKPFLHLAWELVTRWETLEPPVHRCPVPEPIVKAVAFLAHSWQLSRWAAVVLLAFYGLARVGEVLRCRRCDLLFPSDLLDECSDCLFLRFNESKTSTRGRPKIQHTKVTDPSARAWIQRALENVPKGELLWPGSPSAFRYRWDLVLRCLGALPLDAVYFLAPSLENMDRLELSTKSAKYRSSHIFFSHRLEDLMLQRLAESLEAVSKISTFSELNLSMLAYDDHSFHMQDHGDSLKGLLGIASQEAFDWKRAGCCLATLFATLGQELHCRSLKTARSKQQNRQ
eukprot:s5058_g1.t1